MPAPLDRAGWSPLHYAALEGDVEAMDALIADGLAPDLPDGAGYTPFTSRPKDFMRWSRNVVLVLRAA